MSEPLRACRRLIDVYCAAMVSVFRGASASSVGKPARLRLSTSAFLTQSFNVCAEQPIFAAIDTQNAPTPASAGRPQPSLPEPSPRNGARRCAIRKAPRQPPLPNTPKSAKLKPGVSLRLDKSWGQRHRASVVSDRDASPEHGLEAVASFLAALVASHCFLRDFRPVIQSSPNLR